MPFNKPDISQLSALGNTVGDVYFPQTKLLLPFDGVNSATTTNDLSNSNHAATFVGNAQISTAQSKFGGSSLYVDGTGDYLTLLDSSDWDVGNQSFTAECWIYPVASPNQPIIMGQWNNPYSWALMFSNNSNRYLRFAFKVGAAYNDNISSTAVALNTWSHVALVRDTNNVFNMYLNGVSIYNTTITGTADAAASVFSVGGNAAGTNFNGYIDSLRFTKGMARYTSTFTPPTTTFLTSAGDVNKQIIVNSTADGVAIGTGGINQARVAKAWCFFDMTVPSITESYNVSSLTDSGTGTFNVNFSTAMSSATYATVAGSRVSSGGSANYSNGADPQTADYCRCTRESSAGAAQDVNEFSVVVFGN
jgi:hypothetical protein